MAYLKVGKRYNGTLPSTILRYGVWIGAFSFFQLSTACTTLTREIEQTPGDVAEIQVSIKRVLIEDSELAAAAIAVNVVGNSVTLTGFVDSEEQAAKAARLATQGAPGYTISNQLETR